MRSARRSTCRVLRRVATATLATAVAVGSVTPGVVAGAPDIPSHVSVVDPSQTIRVPGGGRMPMTRTTTFQVNLSGRARPWYVLSTALKVVLSRREPLRGFAIVSVLMNDAAIIQYKLKAVGPTRVGWSAVDLFRGDRRGVTARRSLSFVGRNYAGRSDAHDGRNLLRFQVEAFNGIRIRSVTFSHTKIRATLVGPPHIRLTLSVPGTAVKMRHPVSIRYELRSSRSRIRSVEVEARADSGVHVQPAFRRLGSLRHAAAGQFTVEARTRGQHRLLIGVRSPSSHPVGIWTFDAVERTATPGDTRPFWAIALIALGLTGILMLYDRPGDRFVAVMKRVDSPDTTVAGARCRAFVKHLTAGMAYLALAAVWTVGVENRDVRPSDAVVITCLVALAVASATAGLAIGFRAIVLATALVVLALPFDSGWYDVPLYEPALQTYAPASALLIAFGAGARRLRERRQQSL